MRWLACAAVICAVGALSASTAAAEQPVGTLTFDAAPGAVPVDGRSGEWDGAAVWEYQHVVKIDAESGDDWIRIELNGRDGEALTPGTYLNVRNHETHPDGVGIQVVSDGLGCVDDYASFTITRIERGGDDQVTAFEASVEQHCGSPDGPALHAQVYYAG